MGYCLVGPEKCSCTGMFREGREKGTCYNWVTPATAELLQNVFAEVEFTTQDIDDLLDRLKLTGSVKRKLRQARSEIARKRDDLCRSR